MNKLINTVLAAAVLAAPWASATDLTATMRVDDTYTIYLSTDPHLAGAAFGTGTDFTATSSWSTALAAGQDYYLHITAKNLGSISGLLGEFKLDDTGFAFANGTQRLVTNTTNWDVSNFLLNQYPVRPTAATSSQIATYWGDTPGVASDAQWIWSGNRFDVDRTAYFSTKISSIAPAVPEPGSLAMLGFGLAGVVVAARRRRG